VGLVRGELPGLARATLSSLVVMDVHARDVAAQLAAERLEGQPGHFSWLSQLRLYWEVRGRALGRQLGRPRQRPSPCHAGWLAASVRCLVHAVASAGWACAAAAPAPAGRARQRWQC
jgi:hypothetical protein